MTQPKSKSSKSKSKKPTTPATSKKVIKRSTTAAVKPVEVETEVEQMPEPTFTTAAPVALPEPLVSPVREVTRAEFLQLVRNEAYRRATRRNFRNGSPFQDWVNAEAAVSGKLAAEGARLS